MRCEIVLAPEAAKAYRALPVKGPFEVSAPSGLPVTGVVLSGQVKSLDWRARRAEFVCALEKHPSTREEKS